MKLIGELPKMPPLERLVLSVDSGSAYQCGSILRNAGLYFTLSTTFLPVKGMRDD
jgi:hypothetical protein